MPPETGTGTSITVYTGTETTPVPLTVTSQCNQTNGEIGTLVLTPGQAMGGVVVESITGTGVDPTTCFEGMAGCAPTSAGGS